MIGDAENQHRRFGILRIVGLDTLFDPPRTPVLLRWPGRIKPARYDDLVSTIDIVPTILEAVGVP